MAGRITTQSERALTTTVNDIENIEASSYNGLGIIKVYFQPGATFASPMRRSRRSRRRRLKQMPAGADTAADPQLQRVDRSDHPVALSGSGLSEQTPPTSASTPFAPPRHGSRRPIPLPYGGKLREVQIDLDSAAMQARNLSGQDVANALAAQNLITPVGTEKIGSSDTRSTSNDAPSRIVELGDLPIKASTARWSTSTTSPMCATGNPPQPYSARQRRSFGADAGAQERLGLDARDRRRHQREIAEIKDILPRNLQIAQIGDQSIFIKAAINSVIREGVIAAAPHQPDDPRFPRQLALDPHHRHVDSTLGARLDRDARRAGRDLNIMTLGGLALAVGILVDDATVTIENINYHLEQGKESRPPILDGAAQIVTTGFRLASLHLASCSCRCSFCPAWRDFLFVPMAEAVMSAMACSFILSRTLVPTMANYLLRTHAPHTDEHGSGRAAAAVAQSSGPPPTRLRTPLRAHSPRYREPSVDGAASAWRLCRLLPRCGSRVVRAWRPISAATFFRPSTPARFWMHARTRVGTRIEDTAAQFGDIEKAIRQTIPADQIDTMVDNIGFSGERHQHDLQTTAERSAARTATFR